MWYGGMDLCVVRWGGPVCGTVGWTCVWYGGVDLCVVWRGEPSCNTAEWTCVWYGGVDLCVVRRGGPVCGTEGWTGVGYGGVDRCVVRVSCVCRNQLKAAILMGSEQCETLLNDMAVQVREVLHACDASSNGSLASSLGVCACVVCTRCP